MFHIFTFCILKHCTFAAYSECLCASDLLLRQCRFIVISEIGKRVYYRQHLTAEVGQSVLDLRRHFMVVPTVCKPVVYHLPQTVRQNLLRYSVQIALQFIESPRPRLQVAQDKKLPLPSYERNSGRHRARRQFVFCFHIYHLIIFNVCKAKLLGTALMSAVRYCFAVPDDDSIAYITKKVYSYKKVRTCFCMCTVLIYIQAKEICKNQGGKKL